MAVRVVTVCGIRHGFSGGGHGCESDEVGLDLRPCGWIFFGGDRRRRVSIVNLNVLFDAGRNGLIGRSGETVQEVGVGRVSEQITARFYNVSRVEVAIGQWMVWVPELMRDLVYSGVGM